MKDFIVNFVAFLMIGFVLSFRVVPVAGLIASLLLMMGEEWVIFGATMFAISFASFLFNSKVKNVLG